MQDIVNEVFSGSREMQIWNEDKLRKNPVIYLNKHEFMILGKFYFLALSTKRV